MCKCADEKAMYKAYKTFLSNLYDMLMDSISENASEPIKKPSAYLHI